MLRYLRAGGKHTQLIWWVLTIVVVVTFVFGFNFVSNLDGSMGGGGGAAGSVDGQPITAQEYEDALVRQRLAFREQYGSDPTDRDDKTVRTQVWRDLVAQRLLGIRAEAAGLLAYDNEVVFMLQNYPPQWLRSEPEFQTDGKFDPQKYGAALGSPDYPAWPYYEQRVKRELPVQKLQERMMASLKLSEPELLQAYHDRFDQVAATVLVVTPDLETQVAAPTPADLDRVYAEYKGRFYSEPRVDLEVLTVPRQYTEEELRPARQSAQNLVDRARQGDDFAELAKSYSEGPGAARGGVIDRVLQLEELGPELGAKLEALQPGQVTDPVQSGGRFIVMKLIERVAQPGQPRPGVRLAQIVVRVMQTSDQQKQEVQQLQARAKSLKSLGKAASEKGLATTRTGFFDLANVPPALAATPEAADWALAAKPQVVSPVFQSQDAFVLAQVAELHPGGALARKHLEPTLRQIAELEAHVQAAKPVADRVAQGLAAGKSLETVALEAGAELFTVAGMARAQLDQRLAAAPDVVGALFTAAPGKVVGPLREPAGWFFARLDGRTVAPADSSFERMKGPLVSAILGARQRTFFSGWLGQLQMKAKVQDLRPSEAR
jgi:peptidyl-prolyl cis-trans isomerase D